MSEPDIEWLAPHEQWGWRAYLRGGRLLDQALDRDLQAHGAQLSEYEILAILSESDGHLRMSALADIAVLSRSRVTHTATRLEERRWVERRPTLGDRRGVELWLTTEGHATLERLAPIHVASVRRHLLSCLDERQFAQFSEAMNAIRLGILGRRPEDAPDDIR